MANNELQLVDIDTHYYEPDDAFTRHLEPEFRDRAYRVVRGDDGVGRPFFGDEPAYMLPRTPTDLIQRPGLFAPDKDGRYAAAWAEDDFVRPGDLPWFVQRDARLTWMDEQGIEAAVLWPSLGLTVEYQMRTDPAACAANLRSFNRWLDEEWGFAHQERLFAAPWLTLVDPTSAVRDLEAVLERGARIVALLFAPVDGRSIGDPSFDPFWSRLAEAGVPVGFHTADSGYEGLLSVHWGERPRPLASEHSAFQRAMFCSERPIMDTLASLVLHNVFGRFPGLQAVSVENGSAWVPHLLRLMDRGARLGANGDWLGGRIDDVPSEIFKHHVSVAPFDDDDIPGLIELIGAERVLLGSDFPHPEGLAEPKQFLADLGLAPAESRAVGRTNAARLLGLREAVHA
jgi:predicted TIM-barrel fold metal-dependent hydrolase